MCKGINPILNKTKKNNFSSLHRLVKMKNVCQTCVFDLEYGLPVAVRDHALNLKDDIPTGDFNKEHFHENLGKELALQGDDLRGAHTAPSQFLERLSGYAF